MALGCPESQPQPSPSPLPARRRRRSIFRGGHPLSQSVDFSAHNPSGSGTFDPVLYQHDANDKFASYSSFRKTESDTPSPTFQSGNENPTRVRPRRRTYVGPTLRRLDDPCDDEKRPPSPQRPSTSWMRRLSNITSSLHDSSVSGSCPQSPSIQSATTPFFPPHNVPQTPNKLVKRPSSQRGFYHSHSRSFSGMPVTPTVLRRPATSHQRSAAMRQRSSTDCGMLLGAPDIPQRPVPVEGTQIDRPPSVDTWRPFFGLGRPRPDKASGRRTPSARQRNRSPRRLFPETGRHPTLLLATSVAVDSPCQQEPVSGFNRTNTARPVSSGSLEARRSTCNTRFSQTFASTKARERHNLFSVEEQIASTPPSQFRSASKQHRDHELSLSQGQQSLQITNGFFHPGKDNFHSNVVRQQQQNKDPKSPSFSCPKTSPMVELDLEHRGRKQSGSGDVPRLSLRRVPNFSELRCESRLAPPSGTSSHPGSTPSPSEQQRGSRASSGSSGSIIGRGKHLRHSAAGSDPSSTLTGSDVDARIFTSADEDETDFQSDTAFDTFSTRAAGSGGSGRRGPPIETIFRNPLEENRTVLGSRKVMPSSPKPLDTEFRSGVLEVQMSRLDAGISENVDNLSFTWSISTDSGELADRGESTDRMTPLLFGSQADSRPCSWGDLECRDSSVPTPLNTTLEQPRSPATRGGRCEVDIQKSLFDWSEEQNNSRDGRSSDVRPRTANGKQLFLDSRGGRSSSRGPPSSLHLRSQSVPLSRDLSMSKESLKSSSKFATWGLGSKGVTEDWDGDFEFDDSDHLDQSGSGDNGSSDPVVQTVKVPKSIMERQESLYGQFGHVQELTVLVEELKRLRIRAKALQIIDGPSSELWKEALGIVNLATSEENEEDRELASFTDQLTASPSTALDDLDLEWSFEHAQSKLASHLSSYSKRQPLKERINPSVSTMPPLRTDPSARARIVLDSLHQDRDPDISTPDPRQKLPFDTQSLRDLVMRAGVVTRALKEVVRRAEGVCDIDDHNSGAPDPPFRQIFSKSPEDSRKSKQPQTLPN